MANSPQARKRVRRNNRRTLVNRARVSRVQRSIRKIENAISEGDSAAAQEALRRAQPEIARAVSKGVLHRNTAARRMSRLSKRIKTLTS